MNRHKKNNSGFSFIELVMMVILVGILAAITVPMVSGNEDARKYELTRKKMDALRVAIQGSPATDGSGHRSSFGYHGDMGHLPATLNSLTSSQTPAWVFNATYGFGSGWRGPYYQADFDDPYPVTTDGWGRAFVYSTTSTPPSLTSYGSDGAAGGSVYASDLTMTFDTNSRLGRVQGIVADSTTLLSSKNVELRYPVDGTITAYSTTTDSEGRFLFNTVPFGVRSIAMTGTPAIGPKPIVVDSPETLVSSDTLNYFGNLQKVTLTSIGCNGSKHRVNLASSYLNTITSDYMTFWWEDSPSRNLNTVVLNSVADGTTAGVGTGTRMDITKSLVIPPNSTVPMDLWWNGSMTSREVSGILEWNSMTDQHAIAWETLSCATPMSIHTALGSNDSTANNTITLAYTVPPVDSNLMLAVTACGEDTNKNNVIASGATFGASAMTSAVSNRANAGYVGANLFYLYVTGGASGNIVVNWAANNANRTVHAVTIANAANAGPDDTDKDAKNFTASLTSGTVTTTVDNEMVITAGCYGQNTGLTAAGTNHTIANSQTPASMSGALGYVPVATAATIKNIGFTGSANNAFVILLSAFTPAM